METERTIRRLAAVLFADVVGYSRLMEADESDTYSRLAALRDTLLLPQVDRHRGRIFKMMGDGFLVEFDSVVDAADCAVALQRELAERNRDIADRIGNGSLVCRR